MKRIESLSLHAAGIFAFLLVTSCHCYCHGQIRSAQGKSAQEEITVQDCRVTLFQSAVLASTRSGIIDKIEVLDGDLVSEGLVIAQIRDDLASADVATATVKAENDVDLRYATKLSELSQLEYSRALALNKEIPGAQSELAVRNLKIAAERALLQIEQASHQLEIAKLELQTARIVHEGYSVKAPFEGVILRVQKCVGESVKEGEPIADLANLNELRVEGFLPLEAAWQVRRGQAVEVQVNVPDLELEVEETIFRGEIVFVDAEVQEVSQQVRVWAKVSNNKNLLKSGLIATMRIPRSSPRDVALKPSRR
jgi:RND family efflux transporter MFP subunit